MAIQLNSYIITISKHTLASHNSLILIIDLYELMPKNSLPVLPERFIRDLLAPWYYGLILILLTPSFSATEVDSPALDKYPS